MSGAFALIDRTILHSVVGAMRSRPLENERHDLKVR
jgi:hypothetical protein